MLSKHAAIAACFVLAALSAACARAPSSDPDLILTGGRVYPLGAGDEVVEAIAVRGDSVLAMGTDAEILPLAGPHTQEMPLEDSAVLPGTYDAWIDLEALGRWSAAALDLRLASSIEEVQAMVRNAAGASAADEWILGWGWDPNEWPDPSLSGGQALAALDALGLSQPILLLHRSGLIGWINSAALLALPDARVGAGDRPPGGGDGPRGLLIGSALNALDDVLEGDEEQRAAWVADGARLAAAAGITRAATPPVSADVIGRLLDLEFRGLLPLRVDVRVRPSAVAEVSGGRLRARLDDSRLLRIAAVGLRLDGPLSWRLSILSEPYLPAAAQPTGEIESGPDGLSPFDEAAISAAVEAARRASLPLHVQASGDRAVARALTLLGDEPPPGSMLIGSDLLPDQDQTPMSRLDVAIAPARFARDIYALDSLLGPDRVHRAHAWRDLAAAGASLAFASDAPAYSLRPLAAIATAATRRDAEGYPAGGWNADQALPQARLVRALRGPTGDSGPGLSPGDPADLVVWSEDPVLGDAGALRRAEALLTIVAGRVAFSRPLVELPMETSRNR